MTTFDANKFFKEDTTTPDTTSTINMATDGLPLEVLNYVDNYNQQKETQANLVKGYGFGFGTEIGSGLALSYALNSSGRATNAARNAKYIYQTARGIQAANVATSGKSITPWGAAAQVAGFVGTEAAIWASSNYFGQSIRKAYGVQDKIYAGELISTAVFGSFAQPIEKGMEALKIGDKVVKWRLSDGLADLGAWKTREVIIKGVPKMVSGASLGLAESALRQELSIQVFGDQEDRNAWDYLISTGAGAGVNSFFGIFSKTGAWGRNQAQLLSQRAVDNMSVTLRQIDDEIAAHIAKGKGGNPRAYQSILRKLNNKKKEHEDALAILQDNVDQLKQADGINTKVETETPTTKAVDIDEKPPKPLGDETPEVKPVQETTDAPTTPGTIDDYWSSLNKHLNETRDFSIKPVGADDPNRYLIIDNKTNKQVGRVERIIKDGEITFDQIAAKDADGNLIKGQGLVDTIYDHDFGYVNKNNLSGNVDAVSRKVLKEFDKRSDQVDIVSRTGENVADGVQIKFKGKQATDAPTTPKDTPIKFTKQNARTFLSEIETGTGSIKDIVNKKPKYREASINNVRKKYGDTVRVYRVYTLIDGGKMRPDEVVSVTVNPSTVRALDGSMPEALISDKGATTGQRVFRAYDVPVENVVADVKLLGDEAIKKLNQQSIQGKRNKVSIQDIQDTIDSEGELIVDLTGIDPINETQFGGGLERRTRKSANLVPKNKLEEFIEEDIKFNSYTFTNKEGKPTKDINEILAARDNNKEYFEAVEKVIQFNKDFGIDAPTTPKDTPVPKDKIDQEIEQWDKDWKNAVNNDVGSTVVENIIIRANKLFDNAIFNENIFLRKFTQGKLTKENLVGYRDTIITQIKLLDSVFAQINSLSGRAIRANRADIENVANRSVDSQNTAQLKIALNNLKTRLDEMIGDDVDDFVPTVNKLLDEEDVVSPGKGEGIDSDVPTATTSKVQDALEKRIAKLQKELDDLVKGTEKAKGEGKPKTSRTEDARIVALKRSIKNVKKYKAEAKKVTDLESEVARLAKIAERNDIDEMRGAIKGSPKKPKEELNKRIAQLKKQQQAAKKLFRERVRKALTEEQKALRNQERLKLYKAIRDYTESEIAQNASNTASKVLRGARLMRKMALVNSLTSVQAGVATGVIEMFKLLPRTLATRLLTKGKAGDKFAMHELEGASYAWSYLFNKEKRGQVWKHMTRAFKEGEDPMFDKSSRFNDDTPLDQQILPSGTRKIIQKATRDAEDEAMGVEGLNKFLKEQLSIGGFLKLLSYGGRGILAMDSGFKKILFEQKVLVEMRQQGTLKFPNDPKKAREYSDKLFKNAFEDSDGLLILGKLEEMEYDFMKITENLMMASRTNNIEDVADNMIRKTFIDPIAKIVNDDSHMRNSITAAILETVFFTFYKTAVYTVAKSAILANPLRVLGLKMNPYKDLINDLNRNIAKERIAYKQFREQLKDSKDDATKERLKKELQQSNQRVKEFETRIDRAEKRKFKYNQEVLTDVIMQIGVGGMAFGAGYAGYATGSNAFLTEAQKKRNPNMKPYQFMGTDYKAAAPIVFLTAFMADLGRYTRELGNVDKNGKPKNLSKETTPLNMFLKSIASAAQEMPTSQASRDVRNLFDEDKLGTVVSKWVASYIPNPAQVKKITRQVLNGEDVPDLRGASFGERLVYSAFGFGNKKIRRNMMGEPEISSYTAFHTVNRYAGSRNRPYEPWEEVVATDKEAVISLEPSPKLGGLNMREFVDEEGTDLYYHFLKRIQEYGLQDIMNDFVESNQFQADFTELQIENNEAKNLGLESFKTELRYHYNIIKEDLLADESFLKSFIGEDERTILEHLDNTDEFIQIDKAEPMELKTLNPFNN